MWFVVVRRLTFVVCSLPNASCEVSLVVQKVLRGVRRLLSVAVRCALCVVC